MPPGETIAGSAQLAGAERAVEARREQRGRALHGAVGVVRAQRRARTPHGPCSAKRCARVGAGLGVDDEAGCRPCRYSVDRASSDGGPTRAKPSCAQQRRRAPRRPRRRRANSMNDEAARARRRRRIGELDAVDRARAPPASPPRRASRSRTSLSSQQQRAHRVDRGAPVRRLAEHVVEDLERQRAAVARAQHLLEEADDVELALAREVAVVARPLQRRPSPAAARRPSARRRSARPGSSAIAAGSSPQRQRVEAVEDEAEVRMVRALDDLPGLAIAVDVAAPGERLEADAQVAPRRALGERVQLRRRALGVAHARAATCSSTPASAARRAPASGRTCARRGRGSARTASSGMPSKSRNGWYRSIARPRSAHIAAQLARRCRRSG